MGVGGEKEEKRGRERKGKKERKREREMKGGGRGGGIGGVEYSPWTQEVTHRTSIVQEQREIQGMIFDQAFDAIYTAREKRA